MSDFPTDFCFFPLLSFGLCAASSTRTLTVFPATRRGSVCPLALPAGIHNARTWASEPLGGAQTHSSQTPAPKPGFGERRSRQIFGPLFERPRLRQPTTTTTPETPRPHSSRDRTQETNRLPFYASAIWVVRSKFQPTTLRLNLDHAHLNLYPTCHHQRQASRSQRSRPSSRPSESSTAW